MGNITKLLLKHRVLRATQHAYLPHKGTDAANLQAVNTLETAYAEKQLIARRSIPLGNASFD